MNAYDSHEYFAKIFTFILSFGTILVLYQTAHGQGA